MTSSEGTLNTIMRDPATLLAGLRPLLTDLNVAALEHATPRRERPVRE